MSYDPPNILLHQFFLVQYFTIKGRFGPSPFLTQSPRRRTQNWSVRRGSTEQSAGEAGGEDDGFAPLAVSGCCCGGRRGRGGVYWRRRGPVEAAAAPRDAPRVALRGWAPPVAPQPPRGFEDLPHRASLRRARW